MRALGREVVKWFCEFREEGTIKNPLLYFVGFKRTFNKNGLLVPKYVESLMNSMSVDLWKNAVHATTGFHFAD